MQKGLLLLFVSILLNCFSGIVAAQTNSDYLESLEGEASGLILDQETQKAPEQRPPATTSLGTQLTDQAGAIVELTPGLTVEQFESVLKNNYIGSFLFYKRLDNSQKDEVYVYYQDNPDPSKIREKILQVSKK